MASSQAQPKPKRDLDRLGIFRDEGYLRGVEPYIPPDSFVWNEAVHQGKQFGTKVSGSKDGTNGGYFSEFVRTFEGESTSDPLKEYRKSRHDAKSKYYAGQFFLSSPGKKLLGYGQYQGTFGGQVEALSPVIRQKKSSFVIDKPRKIFKIKPPKKGSGYGTGDCTINPYPLKTQPDPMTRVKLREATDPEAPLWDYYYRRPNYMNKNPFYTNPADLPHISKLKPISGKLKLAQMAGTYFKPNGNGVKLGGCKAGCFTQFSDYGAFYFPTTKSKVTAPVILQPFITGGTKSSTFKSIVQTNVEKSVTTKTYKKIDGVMYVKNKKKPFIC